MTPEDFRPKRWIGPLAAGLLTIHSLLTGHPWHHVLLDVVLGMTIGQGINLYLWARWHNQRLNAYGASLSEFYHNQPDVLDRLKTVEGFGLALFGSCGLAALATAAAIEVTTQARPWWSNLVAVCACWLGFLPPEAWLAKRVRYVEHFATHLRQSRGQPEAANDEVVEASPQATSKSSHPPHLSAETPAESQPKSVGREIATVPKSPKKENQEHSRGSAALIPCPTCTALISRRAAQCPKCETTSPHDFAPCSACGKMLRRTDPACLECGEPASADQPENA